MVRVGHLDLAGCRPNSGRGLPPAVLRRIGILKEHATMTGVHLSSHFLAFGCCVCSPPLWLHAFCIRASSRAQAQSIKKSLTLETGDWRGAAISIYPYIA